MISFFSSDIKGLRFVAEFTGFSTKRRPRSNSLKNTNVNVSCSVSSSVEDHVPFSFKWFQDNFGLRSSVFRFCTLPDIGCRAGVFWQADACSRSKARNGSPFWKHTAGTLSAIILTSLRPLLVLLSPDSQDVGTFDVTLYAPYTTYLSTWESWEVSRRARQFKPVHGGIYGTFLAL